MFNYYLKAPVSVYESMKDIQKVERTGYGEHGINFDAYNKKREIWNNYIKTSKRNDIYPIGSVVVDSKQELPRYGRIIIDVTFRFYGHDPKIDKNTTDLEFQYVLLSMHTIDSMTDFLTKGETTGRYNSFLWAHSNVAERPDYFDSLISKDIKEFVDVHREQEKVINEYISKKYFIGTNANDEFIYDNSHSHYFFRIKKIEPDWEHLCWRMIPEDDIKVIALKRKYETGTLSEKYYDYFVKSEVKEIRRSLRVWIDDEFNLCMYGKIVSDKDSLKYIRYVFNSYYKHTDSYHFDFNWKKLKPETFVLPRIQCPEQTASLVKKYYNYFYKHQIYDYSFKNKRVIDYADTQKERWILFDENYFAIQMHKRVKHIDYYSTKVTQEVVHSSINSCFKKMVDKKFKLNPIGEMMVKHNVFTKEEIISVAKSSI